MDVETTALTIIAHSGDARTEAFTALREVKEGNFDSSKVLLKQSHESIVKAHQAQTNLLVAEANGDAVEINVLLVHSQDHLMTSMLALELIEELIVLHEVKEDKL